MICEKTAVVRESTATLSEFSVLHTNCDCGARPADIKQGDSLIESGIPLIDIIALGEAFRPDQAGVSADRGVLSL